MRNLKRTVSVSVVAMILGTGILVISCGGDSSDDATVNGAVVQETVALDQPMDSSQMTDEDGLPRPGFDRGNSMLFDQLADEQIVTQEQTEQLQQLMQDNVDPENKLDMSDIISEAVTLGIITQEQADEITEYMNDSFQPLPGDDGDSQRPPFGAFDSGMFDRFVDEGTITQEQAEQIQQLMQGSTDTQTRMDISEIVSEAVAQGIISQEQADVIVSGMGQFGGRMGQDPGQ